MPLHTVYRPKKIEDFWGNDSMKKSLMSVLSREQDKFHTYLFTGPAGCGKTTLALLVKDFLGCKDSAFRQFNAANTRGIGTIREVIDSAKYAPSAGDIKVYFFDECHQITPDAREAFLKETEEPEDHVFYIFSTSEPEKLQPAFKRRAFHGEVKPLQRKDMMLLLKDILSKELLEDVLIKEYPETILEKIVKISNGSPGVALNYLDTVIDISDDETAMDALEVATYNESSVIDICQILIDFQLSPDKRWGRLQKLLAPEKLKGEPEKIRRGVLTYMEKVLLGNRFSTEVADVMIAFWDPLFNNGRSGLIACCFLATRIGGPNV